MKYNVVVFIILILGIFSCGKIENSNSTDKFTYGDATAVAGTQQFKDAAVVMTLPPGAYTVVTSGVANTTGTALVEVYDLDP